MQIHKDNKGHDYVEVENMRITYLPQCAWDPNSADLRIQAYRDGKSKSLHRGAEIPIKNRKAAMTLIAAVAILMS